MEGNILQYAKLIKMGNWLSYRKLYKILLLMSIFSGEMVLANSIEKTEGVQDILIRPRLIEGEIRNSSYTDNTEEIRMSLYECINAAIETNPIMKKYYFDIKAQKSLFDAARTKWLPTIEIEGDPALTQYYNYTNQKLINTPKSNASPIVNNVESSSNYVNTTSLNEYDAFSLEQDIGVDIYIYWDIINASRTPTIKSQWELIRQIENIQKLSARKLIAEVTEAYIKTQGAIKIIEELEPLINISIKSEKELQAQLEIGYSDIGQVSQSQTQVLNLLNTLAIAKGNRDKYSAILTSLVGVENTKMVLPSDVLTSPNQYKNNLKDAIAVSIQKNELKKAYIDAAESAEWAASAYENGYLPKIYLYLNWYYGSTWGISDAPTKQTEVASNSYYGVEKGYYAGLGFTWQFDGGENIFNAKSKRATASALRESAKSAEIDFVGKTRESFIEYKRAMQSIQIAEKAVKTSKNNLKVLELRSEYGLQDVTTTVQAFDLYNESLDQWIRAVELANISLSNLYRYTSTFPSELNIHHLLEFEN